MRKPCAPASPGGMLLVELLWLLAEMAADCSEVMLLDLLPSPSRSPLSPTESTAMGEETETREGCVR